MKKSIPCPSSIEKICASLIIQNVGIFFEGACHLHGIFSVFQIQNPGGKDKKKMGPSLKLCDTMKVASQLVIMWESLKILHPQIHRSPTWTISDDFRGHSCGDIPIHPQKLTWHLKMETWKRRLFLETIIFRCHVSCWEGIRNYLSFEVIIDKKRLMWIDSFSERIPFPKKALLETLPQTWTHLPQVRLSQISRRHKLDPIPAVKNTGRVLCTELPNYPLEQGN